MRDRPPQIERQGYVFGREVAAEVEPAVPRALDIHRGWAIVDVRAPAVEHHLTPGSLDGFLRRAHCRTVTGSRKFLSLVPLASLAPNESPVSVHTHLAALRLRFGYPAGR